MMETTPQRTETALLILAAGSSSRLGRSKQLLPVGETTLLEKTIAEAIQANLGRVYVVLGARVEEHRKQIGAAPVTMVRASDWAKGMGYSLKTGLAHICDQQPEIETLLVLVCDQPGLSATHLQRMAAASQKTGKPIVTSGYAGTQGVPVLFQKAFFDWLRALPDTAGAKKLIAAFLHESASVDFPEGVLDIDTEDDYQRWLARPHRRDA
ncbi:MAG: nucleotidyltransferase family protein [Cyclobacteriaceae bacterium]|jgi:molybdenum cofactor cytidylyltransferase|nr:nucleotidyltransferase family protein [Cyclobacteriaceae bacterium]